MEFLIAKEPKLAWPMFCSKRPGSGTTSLLTMRPVSCFFWARNAIYHSLKILGVAPSENILVPSYICSAAVEPILRYGAKVKFYDIYRDCSPNFDDLRAKIDQNTRAIVAIHYFGFPQPIRRFQELCAAHNLYLIEDCAHVLKGESHGVPLGSFGDISIYSWRKFLPLYDGGQLIINNPRLNIDIAWQKGSPLFRLKVAKNLVDKLINDSANPIVKTAHSFLHLSFVLARSLVLVNRRQSAVFTINSNSVDFDLSLVNLRMSSLSKRILQNADIPSVIRLRRLNYAYLFEAIKSLPGVTPFFPELPEGVCPLAFPILAKERPNFHLDLRARGIPAVTWGGVIHPKLPREEFPNADFLYQNLISLPIHQSLHSSDMHTLVDILAKTLC